MPPADWSREGRCFGGSYRWKQTLVVRWDSHVIVSAFQRLRMSLVLNGIVGASVLFSGVMKLALHL